MVKTTKIKTQTGIYVTPTVTKPNKDKKNK